MKVVWKTLTCRFQTMEVTHIFSYFTNPFIMKLSIYKNNLIGSIWESPCEKSEVIMSCHEGVQSHCLHTHTLPTQCEWYELMKGKKWFDLLEGITNNKFAFFPADSWTRNRFMSDLHIGRNISSDKMIFGWNKKSFLALAWLFSHKKNALNFFKEWNASNAEH